MSRSTGSPPATTRSASSSTASLPLRIAAEQERRRRAHEQSDAAPPPLAFRDWIATVNPRYVFYRHCEELIAVLQKVADGELRRVMVFWPPRHSKSETVSRLFPAYYLYRHPDRFVGVASYGADLAYTLSRSSRDNFVRGGGVLSRAAKAVKYWLTRALGGLWATGVGGPATGKGYHLGIVDDPLKDWKEASSETIRNRLKDWWSTAWATREEPGGAQVIVQTRWHEDDLSGWLLELEREAVADDDEPEHWYIVNLPAIADPDDQPTYPASCTVHPDWRQPGEALCPERYPLSRLERMHKRIGDYFFGALFQQRPRPRDGGMFSGSPQIAAAVPAGCIRVRYWDKAGAKPGKGDWTAGVLLAYHRATGTWYVEDVVRGQWAADERNRHIRETAALDQQQYGHVRQYIEQPPGLGKESTDAVIKVLAGYPAYAVPVQGDKVERAEPFAAQWQAGNVKLVAGAWNRALLDEYRAFPAGKYDDQVDGGSGAFRVLSRPIRADHADDGGEATTHGYSSL
jgi:predicted phage terminase large subunit-like protein